MLGVLVFLGVLLVFSCFKSCLARFSFAVYFPVIRVLVPLAFLQNLFWLDLVIALTAPIGLFLLNNKANLIFHLFPKTLLS